MSFLDDANEAADILIAEALKVKEQRDELLANLEFAVKLFEGFLALNATAQVHHMRAVIAKVKGS